MQTKNNIFTISEGKIEYDIALFNLTNPTGSDVNVNLFNVNGPEIPNTLIIDDVGIPQFYITGDTDYNLFVRDTFSNPKKLQRIKIFAQTDDDLNNNFQLVVRNADGNSCSYYKCPDTSIYVSQAQGKIAQVEIEGFTLDKSSYINYTIPAGSRIKWLLYYQEYTLSDMLPNTFKFNQNMRLDQVATPMTYTEEELKASEVKNDWADYMETTNWKNR